MNSLALATDGYLSGCGNTLPMATMGYLNNCVEVVDGVVDDITLIRGGGGEPSTGVRKLTLYERMKKQQELDGIDFRKRLKTEDEEILTIIKIFLECQR